MEKKIKQFCFRAPKDLLFYLTKVAYKNDISVNDLLIKIVKNFKENDKNLEIVISK